jgi:hypothetical protein
MAGFRLPQIVSPTVKWDRIIEKLRTYSTAKFMNEVMALPYDNSANPLSEEDLKGVCIPSRRASFDKVPDIEGTHLFLGVDWGHGDISVRAKRGETPLGYTVMTLGRYDWDGKFQVLGMKRFTGVESDPIIQVQQVYQTAQRLGVTAVGVDHGAGFLHNAQLKQLLGSDRVIEWQATEMRGTAKWVPEGQRMMFNRTEVMTTRFVEIKNKTVKFPCWEDVKPFAPDFLTICVEFRDDGRSMFYAHVLPDDSFHSYMIAKSTADYILNS